MNITSSIIYKLMDVFFLLKDMSLEERERESWDDDLEQNGVYVASNLHHYAIVAHNWSYD